MGGWGDCRCLASGRHGLQPLQKKEFAIESRGRIHNFEMGSLGVLSGPRGLQPRRKKELTIEGLGQIHNFGKGSTGA